MIEQNTVVVFILGGKIYKLAVGTVFAVIIYTGYFDFVVDNGIGIAQDVEAFVCEHLLPAQWFIKIIMVAEGHVDRRFDLSQSRKRILLFYIKNALIKHIAADYNKVRLLLVDACCQTFCVVMAEYSSHMQVGEKDNFIMSILRQLFCYQRFCAYCRVKGAIAAPGNEAADKGKADDTDFG